MSSVVRIQSRNMLLLLSRLSPQYSVCKGVSDLEDGSSLGFMGHCSISDQRVQKVFQDKLGLLYFL